jgi:hypothetical protein
MPQQGVARQVPPIDSAFPNIQDVDVLTDISYQQFIEEYANPGRPAILRGALSELGAAQWTPESMTRRWGHKVFEIEGKSLTFAQIIAAQMASTPENPAPYFRSIDIETQFPELLPDLAPGLKYAWPNYRLHKSLFPGWYFETGGHWAEFFFGGNGGGFPFMHADYPPMHTFIACFYGEKEWIAFSPDQGDKLYLEDTDLQYVCSEIDDIFNPDFDKYPGLRDASPVRARQQAGDLVFMPCNWVHTVRNLSPAISIAVDQLAQSCFKEFVHEKYLSTAKNHPVKARAVNLYLRALGGAMGAGETLMRKTGKDSFRGRVI